METRAKDPDELELPVFIVTETVLFPGAMAEVNCYEDEPERRLVEENFQQGREIGVFLADSTTWGTDDPRPLPVGCRARILGWEDSSPVDRMARVQGIARVQIVDWVTSEPYPKAVVQGIEPIHEASRGVSQARIDAMRKGLQELCFLWGGEPAQKLIPLLDLQRGAARLADFAAFHLIRDIFLKQELLETLAPSDRLDTIEQWLKGELARLALRQPG